MTNKNNLFEDLSKLTGNAAGVVLESSKNIQEKIKNLISRSLSEMDFVTRDEFEVIKKMAEKARVENEALTKRIEILEGKKATVKKSTVKTKAAKSKKPTKNDNSK